MYVTVREYTTINKHWIIKNYEKKKKEKNFNLNLQS